MYKCPTCGAGLVFDPQNQNLLCPSCRNQYNPEEMEKIRLDQAKEVQTEEKTENEYEAVSYKCSHCGAELITTDETITTFCSFCRTGTMLDRKVVKKRKPDYIIPFKITKKECEQIYIDKIKNALFAPKSMCDTQEVAKIRGIYMPYWIYSFEKHGDDVAKGEKYSHRSGDYIIYDDYSLTTKVDAKFSGITHDATSNFSDRLSEAIAPFSAEDKKEFSPAYLSGYYADNEDVQDETYYQDSHKIASKYISKKLGKDKIYHSYKAKPEVELEKASAKLALFPIYFLATKNKTGDRISYAVINGQTGKIAADIPIDYTKFVKCSILFAIIIFIILNLFISFSMPKLIISSIIFNIISMFILVKQNKKIDNIETGADDKGLQAKQGMSDSRSSKEFSNKEHKVQKNRKESIKNKAIIFYVIFTFLIIIGTLELGYPGVFRYVGFIALIIIPLAILINVIKNPKKDKGIYKNVIGLFIVMLVFCFNPASDLYYYGAAIFSIVMTIWSFYNILEKYNILTTRKLPQLEKRGGDENA